MDINNQPSNPGADTLNELNQLNSGEITPESVHAADPAPAASPEDANLDPAAAPGQELSPEGEPGADPDAVTPEGIMHDGQTFATEREAYEYMKTKLSAAETDQAIMLARQEAYESAMGTMGQNTAPAAEPAPAPDEFNEEEYYADPVGYMRQREAKLAENLRTQIQNENFAAKADETAWNEFFAANPDLQGFKSDCEQTLNQHIDTIKLLSRKDKAEGMKFLATKTRAKFQMWAERQKPQTALSNAPAGSGGGQYHGGVTPAAPEKDLQQVDFCSEINNINN